MKKITIFLLFLILLSSMAFAFEPVGSIFGTTKEDTITLNPGTTDDEFFNDILNNNRESALLPRSWKIGGATCSESADKGVDYTPSSSSINRLCYTNNYHIGVAFQLFEYNPWNYLGQLDVAKGEKKCFSVQPGKNYHYDLYYCDNIEQTSCKDTDNGKNYNTYGEVTVTGSGQHKTWGDVCSGDTVQERWCDSFNTVATSSYNCKNLGSDYVCNSGKCEKQTQSCSSHNSKKCYAGHVYWYNSCNQKEDRFDYCSSSTEECVNTQCVNVASTKKDYALTLVSKQISSPSPGVIETTFTIRNDGLKKISGLISSEVLNSIERGTLARQGFYGGSFNCQNSEDAQSRFVLLPGKSSTTTVTGTIGRGGTYPVVIWPATDCTNKGGVGLDKAYPGIVLTGFGDAGKVVVSEPQLPSCSGGAKAGDTKCDASDKSFNYICNDKGSWIKSNCLSGYECKTIDNNNAECQVSAPVNSLQCYTCNGNKVDKVNLAKKAKPFTLFDKIISLITGKSRSAYAEGYCEDQYGYYSHNDFSCVNNVPVTNKKYFDPVISKFQVKDCKSNEFVDVENADLSCHNSNSEKARTVEVLVEFENKAQFSTKGRTTNVPLTLGRAGWKEWSNNMYQRIFTATAPVINLYTSLSEKIPVVGDVVNLKFSAVEWAFEKVGIKASDIREDYNLRLINAMPEFNYVVAELAFYSQEAGAIAYNYGTSKSSRAAFGRNVGILADSLRSIPACQYVKGVPESKMGYIKAFKLLMAPTIDGKCKTFDGTNWFINGAKHGGACKFRFITTIEVPDSGDVISGGTPNVDPDAKYWLHAGIFSKCYEAGDTSDTLFGANKGVLKQVGNVGESDINVCCRTSVGKYEIKKLSQCNEEVENLFCSGTNIVPTTCYRCLSDGNAEPLTLMDTKKLKCGVDKMLSHKWTKEESTLHCRDVNTNEVCDNGVDDNGDTLSDCDDPQCWHKDACSKNPPVTKACYKCTQESPYFSYVAFPEKLECGTGEAAEFPVNSADVKKTCIGEKPTETTTCYTCPSDITKEDPFEEILPYQLNCHDLGDGYYTETEVETKCRQQQKLTTGLSEAYENSLNDSQWCILSNDNTQKCYPKKSLIEISQLDELDQLSFWEKAKKEFLADEENPICLAKFGDVQCIDDGVCLQAKYTKNPNKKDNKAVYDSLEKVVVTRADKFISWGKYLTVFIPYIGIPVAAAIGTVDLGSWITGYSFRRADIETFGVCTFKERSSMDKLRRWIGNLFGWDPDSPNVTYAIFGAIAGIFILILILSKPPAPRPSR